VNRRASQKKSPENKNNAQRPFKFVRTIDGQYDIVCDGINPSVGSINFSLSDVPNASEFTALFDQYKIERVDIEWYPEYTVLSDSGLASNAVNKTVNTAFDPVGYTITTVADVLQYSTLSTTDVVSKHKRSIKPCYLVDNVLPMCEFVTCQSPALNWYGIAFGITPTGIAMTFRSRATFYLSMKISR